MDEGSGLVLLRQEHQQIASQSQSVGVKMFDDFADVVLETLHVDGTDLRSEKFFYFDVQGPGDGRERFDSDVDFTTFNAAIVTRVEVGLVGHVLLGEAVLLPDSTDIETEGTQVISRHVGHFLP